MITNYLPKFKMLEVNNLAGLRIGHMLAQTPAADDITVKQVGDVKFIENGLIVGLGAENKIQNYDKTKHAQMFVHYTEELNTLLPGAEYFAVPVEEDGTYPRCIALYIGDAFTTNNYTGTYEGAKYAKVAATGVLELQAAADADSAFIAIPGTLPNGEEGVEFILYRIPAAA